jgi:hypothetical protein
MAPLYLHGLASVPMVHTWALATPFSPARYGPCVYLAMSKTFTGSRMPPEGFVLCIWDHLQGDDSLVHAQIAPSTI